MVERLAAASKRRGVESVVIAYLGDGPVRGALEAQGLPTVLLEQADRAHPSLIRRLSSLLQRERIDILRQLAQKCHSRMELESAQCV